MANNNNDPNRLITLAIHTYDRAVQVKALLEQEGIAAVLHNVNLLEPLVSTGVRVRIHEKDLPAALKIVETPAAMNAPGQHHDCNIVIPVDFSEYSLKACKVGFEYAARVNGTVVILHAYMNESRRFFLPFSSDLYEDKQALDDKTVKAQAVLNMKQFTAMLNKKIMGGELPRATFVTELREGIPEQCILQCAGELDAMLIVMGTHGNSKKGRAALGSVTAEVLDSGKFPIFTVPENINIEHLSAIRHVVFFSNMIPQDILSFDLFTRLLQVDDMMVSIIPVVEPKDRTWAKKAEEQLLKYCQEHYPQSVFNVVDMKFDAHLATFQRFVEDNHVDLIAIPNKKKNIFSRLFSPSIAHRVLFQSDIPMLVVPV